MAEKCLCTACSMRMPLTYFWTMESNGMSEAFNARIQKLRDASGCTFYEPYSYACALYFYKEGYRNISKALKYKGDMPLGRYVSAALGRKIASGPHFTDVDIIMPVPLHWTRRMRRGHNQADVIAASVARELESSPFSPELVRDVIRRSRRTRSQATLAVVDKAANVSGAFRVDESALSRLVAPAAGSSAGPVSADVAVRAGTFVAANAAGLSCAVDDIDAPAAGTCVRHHILLVDDVFTTGSTLAECQHALRKALVNCLGPADAAKIRISCACLAYVGE